jgi:hypothetical protein
VLIDFFNVVNDAATLMLVHGADSLSVFDKPQRYALAMLFLRLDQQEIVAAEIVWGAMAFSFSDSCDPIGVPSALARLLADPQRLRPSGHELYGLTVTAV